MKDFEDNIVKISDETVRHMLVTGKSGSGKTFYLCRRIEDLVAVGKKVLVLDFSGSYTEVELQKSHLFIEKMRSYDLASMPFFWLSRCQDNTVLAEDIADSLLTVFSIGSYFQKKWLSKALRKYFENNDNFSFPEFTEFLEKLSVELRYGEASRDDIDNVERLLSRLEPYQSLQNFYIARNESHIKSTDMVRVIQLSLMTEKERKIVTKLLLELLWKETLRRQHEFDVVVLDEFQSLGLSEKNAFSSILREGRRFGLSCLLSSQFISNYDKEELETLLQAGHYIQFRPTPSDLRFCAKMIDPINFKEWEQVLNNLGVGEAVVKGIVNINDSDKTMEGVVLCKI